MRMDQAFIKTELQFGFFPHHHHLPIHTQKDSIIGTTMKNGSIHESRPKFGAEKKEEKKEHWEKNIINKQVICQKRT